MNNWRQRYGKCEPWEKAQVGSSAAAKYFFSPQHAFSYARGKFIIRNYHVEKLKKIVGG